MIKRSIFAASMVTTFLFGPALASGKDVVILLATDDPDRYEEFTNFLAEALRSRGVPVVDPSSVKLTYHQRTAVFSIAVGPIAAAEAESIAWIETSYHSSRALFVNLAFRDSSLPYGEFTVHTIEVVCSFRCINVSNYKILKAGTFTTSRRGENLDLIESQVSKESLLVMARDASQSLS